MRFEIKKRILQKVSSSKERFSIELEYAIKRLNITERQDFMRWVKKEFGAKHPNIIARIMSKIARQTSL